MTDWASLQGDRLRVALKVTPGAGRSDVTGPGIDDHGHTLLNVKVTAPPEDGKANAAVIKLLAKRWRVPPGRFLLAKGARARQKVVDIVAADQSLLDKILKIEDTGNQ
ncbi:MAG: DUF167 domain-containing protein [Geminicoccaceae bacterium]